MNISVKEENGRRIISLNGNLDGISSEDTRAKLIGFIEDGIKLTLDMNNCPYVSSAGLRAILTVGKSIKMANGEMNIINLCDEVKDIMDMTGFSDIFKTFEG